jgi:hypothetical protein
MTSPFFGRPTAAGPARKLDVGMKIGFSMGGADNKRVHLELFASAANLFWLAVFCRAFFRSSSVAGLVIVITCGSPVAAPAGRGPPVVIVRGCGAL